MPHLRRRGALGDGPAIIKDPVERLRFLRNSTKTIRQLEDQIPKVPLLVRPLVYKYLGWMCTADGWIPDFTKRTKSAWFVLRSYQKVWKSAVSDTQKRKLFYALVIPVLTYASFTYPNTLTVRRTLHTTCNAMLRYALTQLLEPCAHKAIKGSIGHRNPVHE